MRFTILFKISINSHQTLSTTRTPILHSTLETRRISMIGNQEKENLLTDIPIKDRKAGTASQNRSNLHESYFRLSWPNNV